MSILDAAQPPQSSGDNILTFADSAAQASARIQTATDADQASKAITVGNALGVSPGLVNADLDNFTKILQGRQDDAVISQNPALISYINSHPLAASVSAGDWGPMDEASKAAGKLAKPPFWRQLYDAFKEGAGDQPVGSWMTDVPVWDPNDIAGSIQARHQWALEHPVAGTIAPFAALVGFMPEVSMRGLAGATSVAGRLGSMVTGSEAPEQAAKAALDPGFWASMGPLAAPLEAISAASRGARGEIQAIRGEIARDRLAREYLDSGEAPPVGVHPDFDKARADQALVDKANLDAALAAVQATETHARSPEMVGQMLSHVVSGDIGINADAIAALYGDKAPHPSDGILGWVPGLSEQLASALDTGGDVRVSLKDWLANVTPEVQKALADHIRMRDDGVTVEEAKTPIQYAELGPEGRPSETAADIVNETAAKAGEAKVEPAVAAAQDLVDAVREGAGLKDIVPAEEPAATLQEVHNAVVEGLTEAPKDAPIAEAPKSAEPAEPAAPAAKPTPTSPLGAMIGFTKKQLARYQELIAKRQAEDAAAISERVFTEQRRRISKQWKADREAMRQEHAEEVFGSPVYRLYNHLSEGRIRLNSDMLSDEEKASLPKNWVSPKGLEATDLAEIFGTEDIHQVIKDVAATEAARATARMKPRAFTNRLIEAETNRRMEAKYGPKKDLILQEARDQVLSETQEELLHEQTMRLKIEAGLAKEGDAPPSLNEIRTAVKEDFSKLRQDGVSSARFLQDAGRAGRAMENAHLAGDPAEAFRQSQRQQLAMMYAKEARSLEKERARAEKLEARYSKREVKGTPPEFTNAIHTILAKVGKPIGRRPADLAKEIEAGDYSSLADFVAKKDADLAIEGISLPVADFLLDDSYHTPVDQMSVYEYRGYLQSLQSLDHFGRAAERVTRAGDKVDRMEWIEAAEAQLAKRFKVKDLPPQTTARRFLKQVVAVMHSLDTVFSRWDGRDPYGMFMEMFGYPAAEAMNYQSRLEREFGRAWRELGGISNPRQSLEHDFIDPLTGRRRAGLTRAQLDVIVSNIGNKYNLDRIAFTLGLGTRDPETGKFIADTAALLAWVEKNTTRADIDRAQARGRIFARTKAMSDTVYRNIYGVAPEDIVLSPFTMHGKTYDGWYHPIIQDPDRKLRDHAAVQDTVTKPTSFWPSTANGYTKRRTGAFDYLSLDPKMTPVVLNQILHDIAVRGFVYNSAKIINTGAFRAAITKHYGAEYHDLMKNWLTTIAGNGSYNASALSLGARASNWLRQNVISTYIAFNPSTLLKHGPTAFVMSAKEAGLLPFLKASIRVVPQVVLPEFFTDAVRRMFGQDPALGESLWQFIWNNSEEIQRRDRNWQDTIAGAHTVIFGKSTLRNRIMQWGAKPVALSDMISAAPLWLAKYEQEMAEHGVHGDAVNAADSAVRRAHGSTAASAVPVIAAQGGALAPWFTSLYGFFGANMQRKIEILHDVNDAYHLGRAGDLTSAAKATPAILSSIMAQVVWPALIEELVVGQFTDDRRGFLGKSVSFILQALTNSIIGVRDLAWAFTHGREPSAGLITAPMEDLKNLIVSVKKDRPLSKAHAGKTIQDALTAIGDMSGMMPKPIARAARYGIDTHFGVQTPHSVGDYYRGLTSGQQKRRIER